jgi:hypothetical protein
MSAPFGRRACEVIDSRASGGYRVFSLLDAEGPEPEPGQFYMLATESHWEEGGRPFLPRAFSVADTATTPPWWVESPSPANRDGGVFCAPSPTNPRRRCGAAGLSDRGHRPGHRTPL